MPAPPAVSAVPDPAELGVADAGPLTFTVLNNGVPLATAVPMTGGFLRRGKQVAADVRYRLSRFAYCRRQGEALVLESPRSAFRTTIWGPPGGAVLAELAQPRAYPELAQRVGELAADAARALVTLLAHAELLTTVDDIGRSAEDLDLALRTWAFHDLLFHSRSRAGRHDYPMGGHYPFAGRSHAPPALKPPPTGRPIPLPAADIDRLERDDLPLTRALEQRRSIREHGARSITTAQLGEFLYRVARVRRLHPPATVANSTYESTDRPYPSAGAAYELELYVTVNRCADLAAGLYHYDPLGHRLCQVAQHGAHTEALLEHARASCEASDLPQLLITVTSRFERLSWKYCSIVYANTQKNVGVLFQTMYLVGTAMGLAPCAIGNGNPVVFAQAAELDYFAESSVGEFMLGTVP